MDQNNLLTEESLRQMFRNNADVVIHRYQFGDRRQTQTVLLVYCEGLANTQQIHQFVLPRLEKWAAGMNREPDTGMELELIRFEQKQEIIPRVFSGQLVIYFAGHQHLFAMDIADPPSRSPEDSNTEISIKGPRDGFVETLQTNVALVRKRLPVTSLRYEQFTIGTVSQSKVALLYIDGKIQPAIVDEARRRLNNIDIDVLLGSTQLEEMLSDSTLSLFPLVTYTGRPDFVADSLVRGRFAILVDGSPMAVIAPVNFSMLLKSPEDLYSPFFFASFEMVVRMAGLAISLLLPGFWVALASFNMEQLPFPLLATLVTARHGLPLPGPLEAVLMLGLFELFRESGIRLPKAIGQTMAVVGGIVVGDAVIRAGLASTTMLIVSAVTAVATFTLVNQTLTGSVTVIRFAVLLCSSFLGMYGFIMGLIAIIIYMSRLESFGVPYLAPVSPVSPKELLGAIFRKPMKFGSKKQSILQSKNPNREGGRR